LDTRTLLLLLSPIRALGTVRNLFLWRRVRKTPAALQIWQQHFSSYEYLRLHPDIARSGVDPELHFLVYGNEENRDPSEQFDIRFYLDRYPEVREAGVNALLHYALFGHAENRTPHPSLADPAPPPDAEIVRVDNKWPAAQPLVSVVIPCFNYGRFVEAAIRSVLEQTFDHFEIIVVEGGSSDPDTVAEVRRLESLGLPKTRFFYRSSRHLAGDNRNFGIERALGRYICCLDADDLLKPVYLEVAVFLAEVYGYDFVYPSVQLFGAIESLWLLKDASFPQLLEENRVSTVALFRRSAWAAIGGYRDWPSGAEHVPEDWDFWIRMAGNGFLGKVIREPLHRYRVHQSSLSRTSRLDLAEQGRRLRAVNADLIGAFGTQRPKAPSVVNPHQNLGPIEGAPHAVLFALPFLTIGGAEQLFRTIGKSIVSRGERLIVTTSLTLSEAVPEYASCFDGITPHVYPLPRLFADHRQQREFLCYLIRRYKVATLLLAGSALVYHLLPGLKEQFPELTVVDQLFNDAVHVANNRGYADSIDATVVPSEALARTLTERYGADAARVHVIPHGIRLPEEVPADRSVIPAEGRDKLIVGFFGRLSPEKAPDLFVEIARKLSHHTDLFFVMTGEGPERTDVLKRIRRHRLTDRIHAPGFVEDVLPLLRATDIVVLPSRIDGMPLIVLESQALGKPVVASRVGSLPAIVADQETGFLCEAGDVDAFCRRILELARDRSLRDRMGIAGRRLVMEHYGAEKMLERYYRVFHPTRTTASASAP
jgi:glycosyltransferase involved in cell wall biosynthesis